MAYNIEKQFQSDALNSIISDIKDIKDRLEKIEKEVCKDLITLNEAASFLNVSKTALYHRTCKNKIPCIRVGGKILFSKNELINWLKKGC